MTQVATFPVERREDHIGKRTDLLVESVLILLVLTVGQRLIGFGRSLLFCRWL